MKRTIAALLMFLAMTAGLYSAFYGSMVEEDAYLSASSQFEKKDFVSAAGEYAAFLQKFPESKYRAAATLKMAELSENIEDAMKYYNTVINDFPGTESEAEAVFDLAKLFYAAGDYKKARAYFNIVITKFGSMVWVEESYYMLMLCARAENDNAIFEKACEEYNAKGYFSFKTRVSMAYALYMSDSGQYAKALALYKELIDKTQGKDKNIYMPLVYKRAYEASVKTADGQGAAMFESDLKFKYPDSPEAKGETQPTPEAAKTPATPAKTPAIKNAAAGDKGGFYTIQIGAYSNKKFCDLTAEKLEGKKYEVFVKKDGKFYKLSVGRFKTKQEAESFAPTLAKKEKLKSYLVKQGWEK